MEAATDPRIDHRLLASYVLARIMQRRLANVAQTIDLA
jgi:hypothetical protein